MTRRTARHLFIALLAASASAALPQPAVPTAPARPASGPVPSIPPSQTTKSPVVRAGEAAQMPGKLRPEKPVVPQIRIPLRGDSPAPAAAAADRSASAPPLDERAAKKAAGR